MITTTRPNSWRDLQDEVGRILKECAFAVDVERVIDTARGSVEAAIYAEECIDGRRYRILCECKHWKTRVPQTVVHAVRTVVVDSGVDVGYVIASGGFQTGSERAAVYSNLRLVTWEGFQEDFEATWLKRFFRPQIRSRLDPLFSYTEPLVPRSFLDVTAAGVDELKRLRSQYFEFGSLLLRLAAYGDVFVGPIPKLPLRQSQAPDAVSGLPDALLDAVGYREFLYVATEYGRGAIQEFRGALERHQERDG